MAYAALVSLAQTIDLILNCHHDFISPQFKDEVITIHKYVILLQGFLEDFPDKANSFEGRIKEVALEAEDVIEFLLSKQIHDSFVGPSESKFRDMERGVSQEESHDSLRCIGKSSSSIWSFFFDSPPKHQTWEVYGQLGYDFYNLKNVAKQIESISEQVMEIKNSITVKHVRSPAAATSSSTAAPVHKEVMVGCDADLEEIKSRLCGESSKLEFVPIVGMGGIGKTTLARNIYEGQLIIEYFQIRVWVTVSQDYNVQAIVSSLLVSMKGLSEIDESMQAHHVYQHLKGRRFLIVLDDLWSTKAWDDLKMMFPDDCNGSRIILTTRLSDVACYPDSYSPVHEMRLLDEDQSWNMLLQKVFNKDPCPTELEYVGKLIVKSCGGLPLAIAVISGLLNVEQNIAAWWNIAEDVKSAVSAANDEQLDKILSLSFTRLPHHLRPCFLYMAGYPKEHYVMRASEIIRLWTAEGFLKPNGSKSFEETAEECLEDLVKRSLIQVTKRKSNGRIKIFNMHDLTREMCIRKAHEENFILQVCRSLQERINISRRLCIFDNEAGLLENLIGSRVRTIIHAWRFLGCSFCLGYFRLLRILNMSEPVPLAYEYLCDEIFELFHLRFLGLQFSGIEIPSAISNLQNLQTLVIIANAFDFHRSTVKLPDEIWRMRQLRHIVGYRCDLHVPSKEGAVLALENLQTLSRARNFICSLQILKVIPNLKKLGLSYERYEEDEDLCEVEYEFHNLIHLQQLEKLKLEIDDTFPYPKKVNLAFPRTLKRLTLSSLGLPWKDMGIVGSLPHLQVLKLRDYACDGNTWETIEGEFSELKYLLIDHSDLEYWITESSHFARLKCLVLHHVVLKEIPDGIGEIPTLEVIEVSKNNLVKSAKQIQEEQQENGNNALQVRVLNF